MKTWSAVAILLVLAIVPSRAQEKPSPDVDESVHLDFLELEQDVDKTLLREAMLLQGRNGLKPSSERPSSDDDRRRAEVDNHRLREYIQAKKQAIGQRSDELKKIRGMTTKAASKPSTPPAEADRQKLIEEYQNAQVEAQLLQTQAQMYQQPLQEAIQALAEAEFAASNDPSQREKAEAARKQYEKAKAKFVELSKRLQLEQTKIGEIQSRFGLGGMGGMGGMGCMGGGFM